MDTIAKVAAQFGQALADDMRARGETGWTAERLADTSPVSGAIRARHGLVGAWTDGQSFFMTWACKNPRCASLADFSKLPADCQVWQPAR